MDCDLPGANFAAHELPQVSIRPRPSRSGEVDRERGAFFIEGLGFCWRSSVNRTSLVCQALLREGLYLATTKSLQSARP
jgi:hypothetical protein